MGVFFGTDGLRGIVNEDLTYSVAYKCGNALSTLKENPTIIIGRDTRISGKYLTLAFSLGAMSGGCKVIDVDICPTAGIAYLTRLYKCDEGLPSSLIRRKLNYSNAVTFKNDKNEVVYIVGKSGIDDEIGITEQISEKLGIGFERAFRESISSHIKPENTYFIDGSDENPISSMLYRLSGGLHCMCVEVPKK